MLTIATLAAIQLLLVFSRPSREGTTDHAAAME